MHALLPVFLLVASAVDGSGAIRTESRTPGAPFTRVKASGAFRLTITRGDAPSVSVSADDNLLLLVSTRVKDGVLVISEEKAIRPTRPVDVAVTMPAVTGVETSGACTTTVSGVRGDLLESVLHGAGRMEVDAAVTRHVVKASGAGEVTVLGRADELDVDVTGAIRVDAVGASVLRARVHAGGASSVSVSPSQLLDATALGTSSVRHGAGVRELRRHVGGMGSVRPM